MPAEVIARAIDALLAGEDLGREGAAAALEAVMSGDAGEAQTAGLLVALRAKGETREELTGLASVIRSHATPVAAPVDGLVDTCGTGGGRPTFNISTAAAFVTAGAGVPVAKHGNRSATSRSGSADVLEAAGARIDLAPEAVAECLAECGVGFMFAPGHHPAFTHIVPVRRALGVRTIFNLLGPLTNPAGARRQLLGVSDPGYLERMAGALADLGSERALLVHGRDGLDEVTTDGITDGVEVRDGAIDRVEIDPQALGIARPGPDDLLGGEPGDNARIMQRVLAGEAGPARDVVVLNAAAALWVAGAAEDLAAGLTAAATSIDDGAARACLESFVAITNRLASAEGG